MLIVKWKTSLAVGWGLLITIWSWMCPIQSCLKGLGGGGRIRSAQCVDLPHLSETTLSSNNLLWSSPRGYVIYSQLLSLCQLFNRKYLTTLILSLPLGVSGGRNGSSGIPENAPDKLLIEPAGVFMTGWCVLVKDVWLWAARSTHSGTRRCMGWGGGVGGRPYQPGQSARGKQTNTVKPSFCWEARPRRPLRFP